MGTMMIYTIFSDLQGNFDAVTQFFRETEGRVTTYLCLGDIVQDGKTHDGSRVIDLLREHAVIGVQGNHDAELLKKRDEALQKISHENLEYLAALPETRSVNGFHLVHAPGGRRILDRADAELVFSELPADVKILLFGHSHQPAVYRLDKRGWAQNELAEKSRVTLQETDRYLINPGGVGLMWGAPQTYMLYDAQRREVTLHRLER
ncbi:TPA: metallophosphoesterase family protein [Candidatus Woesearchaeota archaeon]|nr:metallophosphoesterase family protein [Candidatus Woesearchaeota archaeon]HIH47297.1 metallophosphoesterase family protein [Candidatus Woesearchaeota archaeon]